MPRFPIVGYDSPGDISPSAMTPPTGLGSMLLTRDAETVTYLELAEIPATTARRVSFLLLAARGAEQAGNTSLAQNCYAWILALDPDHPLARFPSISLALGDSDIAAHIDNLARIYSPGKAEYLLARSRASGIAPTNEFAPKTNPPTKTILKGRLLQPNEKKRPKRKRPKHPEIEPIPFTWPVAPARSFTPPRFVLLIALGAFLGFVLGTWWAPALREMFVHLYSGGEP